MKVSAVILAGGKGTRLRPLTRSRPKGAIPLANRPMLYHQLTLLASLNLPKVYITQALSDPPLYSFFPKKIGNMDLVWITETQPLGTGGALLPFLHELEEWVLLTNGDVLWHGDLGAFLEKGKEAFQGTILLVHRQDPSRFGVACQDASGKITGFIEKPPGPDFPSHWINGGFYLLHKSLFNPLTSGKSYSIERELFPQWIADGVSLYGFRSPSYWNDVGTIEAYWHAHHDYLKGLWRYPDGVEKGFIHKQHCIFSPSPPQEEHDWQEVILHPEAEVQPPSLLRKVIIGERGKLGSHVQLKDAVVGPESTLHGIHS